MNPYEQIKKLVEESAAMPDLCAICGTITRQRVAFLPDDSKLFNAPSGKQRVFVIPVCEQHDPKDQDVNEAIDAAALEWVNSPDFKTRFAE